MLKPNLTQAELDKASADRESYRKKYFEDESKNYKAYDKAVEDLRAMASKSSSKAFKGFVELGIRLYEITYPTKNNNYVLTSQKLIDTSFLSILSFLEIAQGIEGDRYFSDNEHKMESMIAYCMHEHSVAQKKLFIDRIQLGHKMAPGITAFEKGKALKDAPGVIRLNERQQILFDKIDKLDVTQGIEARTNVKSLTVGPLCSFFENFYAKCTTLAQKRKAMVDLAVRIFESGDFYQHLDKFEFPQIQAPAQVHEQPQPAILNAANMAFANAQANGAAERLVEAQPDLKRHKIGQ